MMKMRNPKTILYRLAKRYIRWHDGFSYDFSKNGEEWLLKQVTKYIPFRTIFDVGANKGSWSEYALKYFPDSHIHCFEISKDSFDTLSKNLHGKCCILNNFGLSNVNEFVEYKFYGKNFGGNTILVRAEYHDKRNEPVILQSRVCRGDDYCDSMGIDSIDLLKIDVEGADHLVLHGFSRMISSGSIRLIQFEYGYTHGDAHYLMRDFFEFFESNGYVIGKLRHGRIEFSRWTYQMNDFDSGPNYVAVRQSDQELIGRLDATVPAR